MIKKLALLSLLLIVGVFIIINFITKPNALRCETDLIDENNLSGIGNVSSDVILNYIFNLNGSGDGIVNIIGFINNGEKRYRVDRTLNFTFKSYDNNNTYEFKYHNKNVNVNDTTPNNLMTALFTTSDENGIHHQRLSKITDNVYLIHDIAQPMLVCHTY
ncbi:hypothetical protein ACXV6R_004095 [Yersinia enterocolitica]